MIIDPKLRDMEDSLRRDYNAARDPNADHTLLIHAAAVLFALLHVVDDLVATRHSAWRNNVGAMMAES